MSLADLVIESARRTPGALAVRGPDGALTYAELDGLGNQLGRALAGLGVGAGDRVGIWLEKSGRGIAAMQACLRLGAAYVPLDPSSPTSRILTIIEDCQLRAVVTSSARARALGEVLPSLACLRVDDDRWTKEASEPLPSVARASDDLAYVLYTSGSTGRPKGVCISEENALAFVRWAALELRATAGDRFANHAPFHFDLSVLDLYVAFLAGGCVSIVPEGASYLPERLVALLREEQITVWYSVPSALILMMEEGGLLGAEGLPLRCIAFAGEPFPIKQLRRLRRRWPDVRLLNLYGPTETNVCTWYEVHEISDDQAHPVPIGRACSGDEVWAEKPDGSRCGAGEEGELVVRGPTVMLGYWGLAPQGTRPHRTGDIVRLRPDGEYVYVGRIDHMVKIRGHRVELGEIEAALQQHEDVREAAVTLHGSGMHARLVAFVATHSGEPPPLLSLKRHCAERLPRYMIVDGVEHVAALPRTGNGKLDRIELARRVAASTPPTAP